MADEKDRFGDKLNDREAAREDQWARQRDAELLEQMRRKSAVAIQCPKCGKILVEATHAGTTVLVCPNRHGAWLDRRAMEILLESEK